MASIVVDASFLVALLRRRDRHHAWAAGLARELEHPWLTCEAALSEAFFLLRGIPGEASLGSLLDRRVVRPTFDLDAELDEVLGLLGKYRDVPMSLADACLVRMTETLPNPVLLTSDSDFALYRRHGRKVIPVRMPAV